ncbi:inositol polyphosphate-5-phosphatase A [Condylostylus longicornis]|uniref:inositol polyphosphate-5-phosphatase A n=1 Tax=Condylostylus longicornis TaxID=2530218 RepID=UPI00244E0DEF|nr:inositol polyphosphate-5-phosphatase A [Condylostylus longicornis]
MEVSSIPVLLITANVGSVFEDPSRLLNSWIKEFLNKVALVQPHFLALHLQEVGGKTYEKSMEYVQEFIRLLCESEELSGYNRIRVYLDEDYNSAEHFTALGNLYFVHHSLQTVKIWNFLTHEWESADGKNIYTGNIEAIATKEKAKFPQHFFPECKWSRKGFLRTRWELNCTVIDLVNIHLFHDASNLAACEEFPSVYCKTRRRALVHTLERFHRDNKNGIAPYFVFGDFNFRCDTEGVVKELTEDLTKHRIQNAKNDCTKMHYKNSKGENVLTVGKKEFTHNEHQTKFKESWLQKFDRELEPLREILVEYPITFAPTYPYEEDPDMPKSYMSTRCPAWCDRILLNPTARELIVDETFSSSDYNIIGENICMGDHKPTYLSVNLKTLQDKSSTLSYVPKELQNIILEIFEYETSFSVPNEISSENNTKIEKKFENEKFKNISEENCWVENKEVTIPRSKYIHIKPLDKTGDSEENIINKDDSEQNVQNSSSSTSNCNTQCLLKETTV